MNDDLPKKQTAADRKRKRQNVEGSATEDVEPQIEVELSQDVEATMEVKPPKRRRRKSVQESSHAPSEEADSSPPPTGPSAFSMEKICQGRRENALRILDEELPAMVVRLRELHRRSKAAADERRSYINDQQASTLADGPWTSAKKRTLPDQLKRLVNAATGLLHQHNELLKEGNEKSFEKKKKSNYKQLQKLISDAANLAKTHLQVQHMNEQDEVDNQKRCLDEARLVLNHPLFDALRPDEEPMQARDEEPTDSLTLQVGEPTYSLTYQDGEPTDYLTPQDGEPTDSLTPQEDEPNDLLTPLGDTAELIELVTAEMRTMVDCSHDLKQWVSLSAPPLDVVTPYENQVRSSVLAIIDSLVENSEANLSYLEEYLVKKTEFKASVIKEPLSIDRMRALDCFESAKAIVWRGYASRMAIQCLRLMDFVEKHIQILEQCRPRQNAVAHLYS